MTKTYMHMFYGHAVLKERYGIVEKISRWPIYMKKQSIINLHLRGNQGLETTEHVCRNCVLMAQKIRVMVSISVISRFIVI